MINWEESERIGRVLKERRKELHLNQEDLLANPALYNQVISNIETGKPNIKKEKYIAYCEMINWTLEDLEAALEKDREKTEKFPPDLALQFKIIESLLDSGARKKGFKHLQKITLPDESPYLAMKKYLLGKYYNLSNTPQNWETCKSNLYEAIKLCNQSIKIQQINIKSACYHELGRGFSKNNDLQQAVRCTKEGIKCFLPKGGRKDIIFTLLLSKALYLDKLGRLGEANKVLEELFLHEDKVNTEIFLNMIILQARLYNKNGLFKEAVNQLNKGIEFARRELNYNRLFELWVTLGATYKEMNKIDMAKSCMETALNLQNKSSARGLNGYLYTELGLLFLTDKNYEKAKEYIEKAVKICKSENNIPRYCDSLLVLSELCLYTDNRPRAIKTGQKALEVATEKQLKMKQKDIALHLARITEGTTLQVAYIQLHYELSVQLSQGVDLNMNEIIFLPKNHAGDDPPPG